MSCCGGVGKFFVEIGISGFCGVWECGGFEVVQYKWVPVKLLFSEIPCFAGAIQPVKDLGFYLAIF